MVGAISFVIFLVIAFVGVRLFKSPVATVWPLLAGCITFALVAGWKALF